VSPRRKTVSPRKIDEAKKILPKQLDNVVEWSGGNEPSIPEAQKKAMLSYLKEKGLVSSDKLESMFGRYLGKNQHLITNFIERKKIIPQSLFVMLKTNALTKQQVASKTGLALPIVEKILLDLETYNLTTRVSRMNTLTHYVGTLKNYSMGKFKHKLMPYLSQEELDANPLRPRDLFVWRKNESTYKHALKVTGRELYLEYANAAAKVFAEENKDSWCLSDQIKEMFGITIREVSFMKTPTNEKEMAFEDDFRILMSKIINKIDPNANCSEEEIAVEEANVFPDILVTQKVNGKEKQSAVELKKATKGHLVDCSIKQFLKYVQAYDYTGIITFYGLPGVAEDLGTNTYTGEEFMQKLRDYYSGKTSEKKKEKNAYRNATVLDPEYCDKVKLTNTYLAYRLSYRNLSKFNFDGLTIQTIVGPKAFDTFKQTYKKTTDKLLFFLGTEGIQELVKKTNLEKEYEALKEKN